VRAIVKNPTDVNSGESDLKREKRRNNFMFKVRIVSRIALFLVLALATTAVPADSPNPSGKVSIDTTSIAAGVGVSWGDGTLSFKGKNIRFSVDGLTLVDWGISKASAVGEVYNLNDASQFAGNYLAGEAGFALGPGMGGISMRNQNGVIMVLRSVSTGARLQLGPSGMKITMK
jgi:hypothetical protein